MSKNSIFVDGISDKDVTELKSRMRKIVLDFVSPPRDKNSIFLIEKNRVKIMNAFLEFLGISKLSFDEISNNFKEDS